MSTVPVTAAPAIVPVIEPASRVAGRCRGRLTRLALLLLAAVWACPAAAATRYDPGLRFQSLTTPHFVIHYHQGEEAEALRLSLLVEEVHRELAARMRHAPRRRTHVILVDQSDDPNGWATPVPYNLIELVAAPPSGASPIGNTDDWLRLVFTHEYAHVLHLDPARGWAAVARRVFGRTPFAFPNLTLPLWQIEGLATFEESRDGHGRVPAGDFHAIVREPARVAAFEPLDRVNGGLADWPAGYGPYAYGAYFHAYLARRFGPERLAELSRRTSGRPPYVTSGAFRQVYGQSLGSLWRDFRRDEAARAGESPEATPARRLTFHGYLTEGPRFDRDGTIVYSRRDAHGFPSLLRVNPGGGEPTRLAWRYGGSYVALGTAAIYFDQLELERSVRLVADLYSLDRRSGAVRRLTRGARLTDPDLSPDGRQLAAVRLGPGQRTLVVLDRERLERSARPSDADTGTWRPAPGTAAVAAFGGAETMFATPRWSPDGRYIAAERRRRGGPSEIVVVEPDSGTTTVVATAAAGRNVTPAWTPDGTAILFASDRDGGPFDLYRVSVAGSPVGPGRLDRIAQHPGGARAPDVSPDGRHVVYVGYTLNGYDLFTVPLPPEGRREPESAAESSRTALDASLPSRPATPPVESGGTPVPRSRAYQPWATLMPRAWLPIVEIDEHEVRAGAASGGADALGYHGWAAAVTWSVSREAGLEPVSPGARPDVTLAYAYDRWRPTLFATYTDETTPLLLRDAEGDATAGIPRPVSIRARSVDLGLALPFRRVRTTQTVVALWRGEHDTVAGAQDAGSFDRGAVRIGWSLTSARRYGYSISQEGGVSLGASLEMAREALGGDGDAELMRGDARAYVPLGPRHAVLAIRASAAASRGDRVVRRTLRLGGTGGDAGVLSFEEDATSLLRGFPGSAFLGRNVALLNAEYRLPLRWVERGVGTWPIFLRALHATAFVDAGHAWTDRFRADGTKGAWGIEIGTHVTAGYVLPVTWTAGVAWGRDGAGGLPDNRQAYVRIGHGF